MTSPRIKRWTLLLTAYDYTIEFVPGKDNCCADFLSRNPVEEQPTTEEKETLQVLFIQERVINSDVVSVETKKILYSEKYCFRRVLAGLKNQLRNYCLTTVREWTLLLRIIS